MSPRSHARQRVLDRAEVARRSGAPASAATQAEPRIAGWLVQAVAWTLALALVVLPLVGLLNGWFASERWPVRAITINARFERISAEQVQATVAPHASKGFFALRLDEIGTALAGLPWVERVEVRKRWPDTLEVTLHEHRAIARWGTDRLLSDHGVLFAAPGADALQGLPLRDGPDSRVPEVVQAWSDARRVLAGTPLVPVGVRLTARGSWRIRLADGADLVLGREHAMERLARFARALPSVLAGETRALARADLRYTNGFALTWREATNTNPEA